MAEECDHCGDSFDSERERLEHELREHSDVMTSHEEDDKKNRLNKLEEKERVSGLKKRQKLKDGALITLLLIGLGAGGFYAYQNLGGPGPATNSSIGIGEPVHWHAPYTIRVCGEERVLQGGPILAHTHGQTRFHLEGARSRREQATLDWIVDQLGGQFSSDSILGYEEPESCPGTSEPGNLTVTVNGEELENPESYIVRDGDRIRIIYS